MTTIILSMLLALGCGDKDVDDTGNTGDGGATDGGTADGGTGDGGTADGGTTDGGTTDGGTGDGGTGDGGTTDGGTTDGGTTDGGSGDGGSGDGGTTDGGTTDGGTTDGGSGDGGTTDGGTTDGGTTDGGTTDGGTTADCLTWSVVPTQRSATCTACDEGVPITFVAAVDNDCDEDVTVTTRSTCLVSTWSLVSGSTAEGWGEACGDAITDWDVPAHDRIQADSRYGTLRTGSYTVQVDFDDRPSHEASTDFTVE